MKGSDVLEKASVSVIVPCYCCSETIERAINSVVNQTQPPKQLILVDDGSTDEGKTLQQLNYLKDKYSCLFQIDVIALDKNQGVSVARNTGWDIATQPYIAFLDADDSWHPQKLEIQYQWMQGNPECLLSGHQCGIWRGVNEVRKCFDQWNVTIIKKKSVMLKNPFSTPTVIMRGDISFRFRDASCYAEDYLLWQQVSYSGYQIARIELPLAYVHKGLYGDSGLSSHMWAMEKADVLNYWLLRQESLLNMFMALCLTVYSLLKFLRRLAVVFFK